MTNIDTLSVIRALNLQNEELSRLISETLTLAGKKIPQRKGRSIRDWVKLLIHYYTAQIKTSRMEEAQDKISTRPVFFIAGKRIFRLDAIALIEFGVARGEESIVKSAKVHLTNGEVITLLGRHAGNIRSVMLKETGMSYYDIHYIVDLSQAAHMKTAIKNSEVSGRNENDGDAEDDELYSADGERGPEISGGETT